MENEYTVGALCNFIATKKKQKKVINKIKDENVENKHQSDISLENLPKNKTLKRLKNDVNGLSRKKQKVNKNTKIIQQSEEKTIGIKSETINNNNQTINPELLPSLKKTKNKKQITDTTDSEVQNQSKIFQKSIKKKNNKKSIDIPAEPNNETKIIKKNNLTSLENLPKNKTLKRPKNDVNGLSRKKQKVNKNTKIIQQSEEKTIGIKSETINNNNQTINPELLPSLKKTKNKKQITDTTDSEAQNQSKIFQKSIKKKNNKKSIDISAEPNNETKIIEKNNLTSNLSSIKSSAEYLEKESRTVFVGNVPVNIKMSAIKSLFKQFGDIETTRIRSVAVKNISKPKRASVIKKDFHPQRDTANMYVRFKTIEQAQSAISLNATQFEGHTIRVDMALNTSHKQDKKKGVFIGNLPYNIQEDEVWNFFKDSGVISAVRIVRDNATGVSKGFGYVDFETKESVELAMQLQGKTIQNREIRIKRIETKTNINKMINKTPVSFKKTRPVGRNGHQFQGETIKPKMQKQKPKLTKTDLMRKKIAKQLKA